MNNSDLIQQSYFFYMAINKSNFGPEYTGINNVFFGKGLNGNPYTALFNSPLTINQLSISVAFHYLKTNSLKINSSKRHIEYLNQLKKNKELNLKIIDLGCGIAPTFARIARKLGAVVYTADIINSSKFISHKLTDEEEQNEKKHHIVGNLKDSKTLDKILERTEGNFDIVTTAHIDFNLLHFAEKLLREKGIYFQLPILNTNDIYIKN